MGVSPPPVENTAGVKGRERGASFAVTCCPQTARSGRFGDSSLEEGPTDGLEGTDLGLPRKAATPPTSTRRKGQPQCCFPAGARQRLNSTGAKAQRGGPSRRRGPADRVSLRHTARHPRRQLSASALPSDFYVHPKKVSTENGRRGRVWAFFRVLFFFGVF